MKHSFFHTLQFKVLLRGAIISALGIVFLLWLGYLKTKDKSYQRALNTEIPTIASNTSLQIQNKINSPLAVAQSVASNAFLKEWIKSGEKNQNTLKAYLRSIRKLPYVSNLTIISELSHRVYSSRKGFETISKTHKDDSWYFRFKNQVSQRTNVSYGNLSSKNNQRLQINVKILDEDRHLLGVVSIRLRIAELRRVINQQDHELIDYSFIVDQSGDKVISYKKSFQNMSEIPELKSISNQILKSVKDSEISFIHNGDEMLLISDYIPEVNWYVISVINKDSVLYPYQIRYLQLSIIALLFFTIAYGFIAYNLQSLSRSIKLFSQFTSNINTSSINVELPENVRFSEMRLLKDKLLEVDKDIHESILFSEDIGKGDIKHNFIPSDKDALGQNLLKLKQNLEQTAQEDEERQWINKGLLQFSQLLQNDYANLQALTDTVLSAFTRYIDCNQSALFLVDTEDKQKLNMISCYAYDRKKFKEKHIAVGEGLIGQSVKENKLIVLNNLPDDFINITSGLGEATPKTIILVPLNYQDEKIGIIELAFFKEVEPYKIDFINQVCKEIGIAITIFRNNRQNKKLVESLQSQTEELRAQEEEMRQNMEELLATQEEMQRKEQAYLKQRENP